MNKRQKFKYLKKLIETYLLFTKWQCVSVTQVGNSIYVIWHTPIKVIEKDKKAFYLSHTMREFPKGDISKRIISYREKLQREIKKRNNEGIVARPKTELVTRGGQRIITKIKYKDFVR